MAHDVDKDTEKPIAESCFDNDKCWVTPVMDVLFLPPAPPDARLRDDDKNDPSIWENHPFSWCRSKPTSAEIDPPGDLLSPPRESREFKYGSFDSYNAFIEYFAEDISNEIRSSSSMDITMRPPPHQEINPGDNLSHSIGSQDTK